MRRYIKNRNSSHLTYYCLIPWFGWLALATAVNAENPHVPSPITEIETIGESLDHEKSRQQELKIKANDLSEEIISISNKVRRLRESIQIKEERIDSIKSDLKKLKTSTYPGGEAVLLHDNILQSSVTMLLLAEHRAKYLSPTLMYSNDKLLLRSAALAALIERLKKQRDKIRVDVAMLKELHAKQTTETKSLLESKNVLEDQRGELELLLHRKSSLQAIIFSEHKRSDERLARLAAKADDLQQLMEVLDSSADEIASDRNLQTTDTDKLPALSLAEDGSMEVLPTVHSYLNLGRVLTGFGVVLENGLASPGLIIDTRPDSDVICLRDGKVVFSGAFRTYGQLLIIEHGQGYHTLLSGFARIYGEVGDLVVAGEPVGVMGGLESRGHVLYVEMRRQGAPINPTGWLDLIDREVRG